VSYLLQHASQGHKSVRRTTSRGSTTSVAKESEKELLAEEAKKDQKKLIRDEKVEEGTVSNDNIQVKLINMKFWSPWWFFFKCLTRVSVSLLLSKKRYFQSVR
jgi:hypothetical protein